MLGQWRGVWMELERWRREVVGIGINGRWECNTHGEREGEDIRERDG